MILATVFVCTALIGTGIAIQTFQGLPSRIDATALRYAASKNSFAFNDETTLQDARTRRLPEFGVVHSTKRCLIWGDSHAKALIPGLHESCLRHDIKGFQATHATTPPLVDFAWMSQYSLREESPEFANEVIRCIEEKKIQVVVLAAMWAVYQNDASFESTFRKTVNELCRRGIKVVIVRDVASHNQNIPLVLSREWRIGGDLSRIGTTSQSYSAANAPFEKVISRLDAASISILDPRPFLVDDRGFWRAELDGVVVYRDSDHLTIEGAKRLTPMFDALFRVAFETEEPATE